MPAIRFVHSTFGVHCDTKGGEICDHTQGLKKPPVPRRLVGESQIRKKKKKKKKGRLVSNIHRN